MVLKPSDVSIALTAMPLAADVAYIEQQIRQFNDAHSVGHRTLRPIGKDPLAVFLRDATGQMVGGLVGATYWGWLYIDDLWIAEAYRSQGHGRTLMQRAEVEAVRRGCTKAHVRTWSFQARGFYERLEYSVVGALDDYPPGETLYWLSKVLQDIFM